VIYRFSGARKCEVVSRYLKENVIRGHFMSKQVIFDRYYVIASPRHFLKIKSKENNSPENTICGTVHILILLKRGFQDQLFE